jgi:hypothetical protein
VVCTDERKNDAVYKYMDVNIYLYYGHQAKVDPLLEFLTVSAESRERGKGGVEHVATSAQNAKTDDCNSMQRDYGLY